MKLCELFGILLELKIILNTEIYGSWVNSNNIGEVIPIVDRETHEYEMDNYIKKIEPELFKNGKLNYTTQKPVYDFYKHSSYGWA